MFSTNACWMKIRGGGIAPLVTKRFSVKRGGDAVIRICGLGFFELFCNGERVGIDLFKPVWSNYTERKLDKLLYPTNDLLDNTIYVYEISLNLKDGDNEISILLGNGWFCQSEKNVEGHLSYSDDLLLCFDININGEHIVSDESLTVEDSFVIFNNVYFGETHDYAHNTAPARKMVPVDKPNAKFLIQDCPCDRVIRTVQPTLISQNGNKRIYDVGENITGWVRLNSSGEDITVKYAEKLNSSGGLDYDSSGGEGQLFVHSYKNSAKGKSLVPFFTYMGFRYFEVEGDASMIAVDVVHSDIAVTSFFTSSDKTLNLLYDNYIRTQLNNMHSGVPTDCPHRERLGYTGDGQLICETALMLTDSASFFRKWIRDIFDCQDIQSGHVQHTAPFYGGGGGPGGWGGAIAIVPWQYYLSTGDTELLKEAFPRIKKYLDCMKNRFSDDGLIVREYEGGWCLGDWCAPGGTMIPEPFVNTYFYIVAMRIAIDIASILDEQAEYSADISRSLSALKMAYYDKKTRSWCGGIQGADAFAADLGLEADIDRIDKKYQESCVFDTGIFGTEVLCRTLWKHGRLDTLYKLLSSSKYPSFGYMFGQGATTLWENWDGKESHNHPMFGACVKYLFKAFLGINVLKPNGKEVSISPADVDGLDSISGGIKTPMGNIAVNLERNNNSVSISVTVPQGVDAQLVFRDKTIKLTESFQTEIFNKYS